MRLIFAMALILVGIIGWLLPVIPGWLLILAGLSLLPPDSRLGRLRQKLVQRLRQRKGPATAPEE